MKISYLILGLFALLLVSCEAEVKPLIEDEKMVKILADIHLSEIAAQTLTMKQKDTMIAKYYSQIMDIHEVSRADFDSTVVFLKQNPTKMAKIYEKVMERIDTEKTNLK
jgi:hypothetical protein